MTSLLMTDSYDTVGNGAGVPHLETDSNGSVGSGARVPHLDETDSHGTGLPHLAEADSHYQVTLVVLGHSSSVAVTRKLLKSCGDHG